MSKNTLKIVATLVGTAIGYGAIATAYMPLAKAAVLTYNFGSDYGRGFVQFSNSGITGIDVEEVTVSEGKLTTIFDFNADLVNPRSHDIAGAKAVFDRGEFRGLKARGSDIFTKVFDISEEGFGEYDRREETIGWYFDTYQSTSGQWTPILRTGMSGSYYRRDGQILLFDTSVSDASDDAIYTLIDTAAEPVPEPMTVAGTAFALASLAGLKHIKKTAKVS
jgi:hypothetical protein